MKKFRNIKALLFGFIFLVAFCFMNTNVYAKEMTPDEIQGPAYVIGSHVFNREVNETTGYDGKLTTNLIMLASKTIESSDLDSMIIYYKTATGMWINGLTGSPIEAPETFEINYTNLQLEEVNNTVSAPKAPILSLNNGPLSIDDETDMMSYQLDIYIDDIEDKSNKVDGVELSILDYNQTLTKKELKYGEDFSTVITFKEISVSDIVGVLEIGKQYHREFITFENKPNGYYTITARAYVLDANGKKTYSDSVYVSIDPDTTFPAVEIVNKYSNPEYVSFDGNFYTYRLGIEKPKAYVFEVNPERFAYLVSTNAMPPSQVGIFGLDEDFSVTVPKDSVYEYYASLGYYDKNGDFKYFITQNSAENRINFTIDTRTLTAPVLSTYSDSVHGEYLYINFEFYKNQEKDTLDYQIEGTEIYRVNWTSSETFIVDPVDGLVSKHGTTHVFPPDGVAGYVARVYATNAEGEKVYSDFSDVVTVVRRPEIEVSEVIDGNVTVKVANLEEYGECFGGIGYKVYKWESQNGGEILIDETNSIDEVLTIPVTANMEIYIKAYSHLTKTYSEKSNNIDIVVE